MRKVIFFTDPKRDYPPPDQLFFDLPNEFVLSCPTDANNEITFHTHDVHYDYDWSQRPVAAAFARVSVSS